MTSELEAELGDALSARASSVTPEAVARLRATEYSPRSSRLSSGLKIGALGGAATLGTIVSVLVVGGSQSAFADWTPAPTTPATGDQTSSASSTCLQQLSEQDAAPGSGGETGWSPVVDDVRGPYTLIVYQAGSNYATCLTGPSLTVVSRSSVTQGEASGSLSVRHRTGQSGGATGTSSVQIATRGSGDLTQVSEAHLDSSNGPFTLIDGRIESEVTGVTLIGSGLDVEATTGKGWFVAWWPSSQGATSAQITAASGDVTQPLDLSTLPPPPPSGASCAPVSGSGSSGTSCSSSGGSGGGPGADPGPASGGASANTAP